MLHNIDVNSFERLYHFYWFKCCTDSFQSFPHKINPNKICERKNKTTKERAVTVDYFTKQPRQCTCTFLTLHEVVL